MKMKFVLFANFQIGLTHTHMQLQSRRERYAEAILWFEVDVTICFEHRLAASIFPKDNHVSGRILAQHIDSYIKIASFSPPHQLHCAELSCSVLWSPRFTNFILRHLLFFRCRYCLLSFWRKAQWLWCDKIIIMEVIFCMFFFVSRSVHSTQQQQWVFLFCKWQNRKKQWSKKKHLLIAIWPLLLRLSILCLVILMSHREWARARTRSDRWIDLSL